MKHFNYQDLNQIIQECRDNNIIMGFSRDLDVLNKKYTIKNRTINNRLLNQPMEGFDSQNNGAPGELTFRRYVRYARGGAGIIWFEAVAITADGRSNPHQLLLNRITEQGFAELLQLTRDNGRAKHGKEPFCILQLTHSGRFSKPAGVSRPVITVHDSVMDNVVNIDSDYPIISDDKLKKLQRRFVEAAKIAYRTGFDAVDIKTCHKYLISELLGARTRDGIFGGPYENRTRFLKETINMIHNEVPELLIAVRLNLSDLIDSENSWGIRKDENKAIIRPDLTEPLKLIEELMELDTVLINVSAGTPYYNPHVSRPFEENATGDYHYTEHPLKGVERLFQLAAEVKKQFPQLPVVGGGYTWLRHFGGNAAAWNIKHKRHTFAGFGRQSFAYPDFAADILEKGQMDAGRCCITCSKCSQLMRWGSKTGCVVRDSRVYAPIYKEAFKRWSNKE